MSSPLIKGLKLPISELDGLLEKANTTNEILFVEKSCNGGKTKSMKSKGKKKAKAIK